VFDIAFSELVLIGIVALVVLGPKRLPEVARAAGRWVARARHFVETVKRDMDLELRKDELAELRQVKEQLTETRQLFEQTATSTLAALPGMSPTDNTSSLPAGETRPAKTTTNAAVRRKTNKKKSSTPKRGSHGRRAGKSR